MLFMFQLWKSHNVQLVTEPTLFSVAAAGKVASVTAPLCNPAGHSSPGSYSRREHRSGLPFPPPGDLPDPGMGPASFTSPALQVGSLPLTPPGKPFSVGGGSERHNEVKVTGGLLEATTIASIAVVWSSIRLSFIGDFSFLWVLERYSLCCEYSSVLLYA